MSKTSCVPNLAEIRSVERNQSERLIWRIPGAMYFHGASRLLCRLAGLEASASLGLLPWLVTSKGVLLWSLSSLIQHGAVLWFYPFRGCLVRGYASMKSTSCSLLAGRGNHWTSPMWVVGWLLPQEDSPQFTLCISGCSEERGCWGLYLCLHSGTNRLCWV